MSRVIKPDSESDELRAEYDFSQLTATGPRGKYAALYHARPSTRHSGSPLRRRLTAHWDQIRPVAVPILVLLGLLDLAGHLVHAFHSDQRR